MDNRYQTQIKIKSLVNLIPEAQRRREFKNTPTKSIRLPQSQDQIQDKFDLKFELLLEKLKADLNKIRGRISSSVNDPDPEFQK